MTRKPKRVNRMLLQLLLKRFCLWLEYRALGRRYPGSTPGDDRVFKHFQICTRIEIMYVNLIQCRCYSSNSFHVSFQTYYNFKVNFFRPNFVTHLRNAVYVRLIKLPDGSNYTSSIVYDRFPVGNVSGTNQEPQFYKFDNFSFERRL